MLIAVPVVSWDLIDSTPGARIERNTVDTYYGKTQLVWLMQARILQVSVKGVSFTIEDGVVTARTDNGNGDISEVEWRVDDTASIEPNARGVVEYALSWMNSNINEATANAAAIAQEQAAKKAAARTNILNKLPTPRPVPPVNISEPMPVVGTPLTVEEEKPKRARKSRKVTVDKTVGE